MSLVACFKNGTNNFFPINTFSISSLYVDPTILFDKSSRDRYTKGNTLF